jgi:hypothetical protein
MLPYSTVILSSVGQGVLTNADISFSLNFSINHLTLFNRHRQVVACTCVQRTDYGVVLYVSSTSKYVTPTRPAAIIGKGVIHLTIGHATHGNFKVAEIIRSSASRDSFSTHVVQRTPRCVRASPGIDCQRSIHTTSRRRSFRGPLSRGPERSITTTWE